MPYTLTRDDLENSGACSDRREAAIAAIKAWPATAEDAFASSAAYAADAAAYAAAYAAARAAAYAARAATAAVAADAADAAAYAASRAAAHAAAKAEQKRIVIAWLSDTPPARAKKEGL